VRVRVLGCQLFCECRYSPIPGGTGLLDCVLFRVGLWMGGHAAAVFMYRKIRIRTLLIYYCCTPDGGFLVPGVVDTSKRRAEETGLPDGNRS